MQYKKRIIKSMKKRAKRFGLKLVKVAGTAEANIAVTIKNLI